MDSKVHIVEEETKEIKSEKNLMWTEDTRSEKMKSGIVNPENKRINSLNQVL